MHPLHRRHLLAPSLLLVAAALAPAAAFAQMDQDSPMRRAAQLDREFRFEESRSIYRTLIRQAEDPGRRAQILRRLAMSYGAEGDCANAARHHMMVVDYWKTQEEVDPQDAFYQQGEMADEAGRVCLDSGDVHTAEVLYRLGYELGNKEPEPRTHPRSLWDFRIAHALGRIASRRGDADEARRQVAAARAALDGDPEMAGPQERFFPYLAGYVALYTGELGEAERFLGQALEGRGANDPFFNLLLAITYERQGRAEEAAAQYRRSLELATGGNPPNVGARRIAREKLGIGNLP